ncbi:MAG: hypothetical protein IPM57_07275 [Oligoflexia bacterium]|nr:hypothetical protein [Oligoflexia bacterium]
MSITTALRMIAFVLLSSTTAFAQQMPVKEWTVLVYMNSDNNLWRFGQLNMWQAEKIGSSDQVNVIVEQDPEPAGMPTTRYYVTRNPNPQMGRPTSKVLQTLGETNLGDWKHLAEFITWGVKNFPAKHYALIVWNHGSGWSGVSYDDNPNAYITMPQIAQALKAASSAVAPLQAQRGLYRGGPLIDILNFDACLMSTLEVAYEVKDVAKILIGSQFNEPGEGEDYEAFLKPLVANPTMPASEFAKIMVYQYTLQYARKGAGINYLALDLSKVTSFTQLFSAVADNHISAPANIQQKLRGAYSSNDFDSDLIGGMTAARKIAATNTNPLASAIDKLVQMYGYPAELPSSATPMVGPEGVTRKGYKVVRYQPGTVSARYSNDNQWRAMQLQKQSDGSYTATIPAAPAGMQMQYVVTPNNPTDGIKLNEALSTFVREGADPIVFHSNFPPTSPVIADAYNFATKGAHGMTLYFYSRINAAKQGRLREARELKGAYSQLQFAINGAPSWTKFLGM